MSHLIQFGASGIRLLVTLKMLTEMGFAMRLMIASANWTSVAFATVLGRFTIAGAMNVDTR